ncbi:MAG: hypothetical protein A2Y33_04695 [Spirochaetes bacterium GWF1_51_8]|nr:MAG: hypothetical protein A2Y33_04695 [Spirochaetes bacterium GWF1_51_8]
MFRVTALILLLTVSSAMAFEYHHAEDPKSYVTRLRFNYNFTYQKTEIEAKISQTVAFGTILGWEIGFMGSITIFIHPTDSFWGAYPVDNLIGYVGLYIEKTNFFDPNLNLLLYPISHESTHLVDGYDRGDIATDKVFDSNEYLGFDITYKLCSAALTSGMLFYIYPPNKTLDQMARPLLFRWHLAADYTLPLDGVTSLIAAMDFALFYENRWHPAFNIGVGADFGKLHLLLHYEYQYGLGQDFRDLQQRFGLQMLVY